MSNHSKDIKDSEKEREKSQSESEKPTENLIEEKSDYLNLREF